MGKMAKTRVLSATCREYLRARLDVFGEVAVAREVNSSRNTVLRAAAGLRVSHEVASKIEEQVGRESSDGVCRSAGEGEADPGATGAQGPDGEVRLSEQILLVLGVPGVRSAIRNILAEVVEPAVARAVAGHLRR